MKRLDRFRELKSEALRALRSGRHSRAAQVLSEVADLLSRLANESSGKLRARRFQESRELREAARDLASRGGAGSAARQAAEDADEERRFRTRGRPSVRFDDIAGLEDVKEQFRLKLVYPFRHPEKAAKYKLRRGGGILLYGPPGTGKTLLARALAGEIDAAFYTVKPSEIMSKWVGEAEKNIEELFDDARSAPVSVIFVDEIDALAPRRSESTSPVMARLVPQILAELEGFDRSDEGTLLFLGATNEPWLLDPAILRPGRFDDKIYVGLPDRQALARMLEIHLEGRPIAGDFDFHRVAAELEHFSGADVRRLCEAAAADAFLDSVREQSDREIQPEDVLRLASEMSPSVSPKMLARYREYAAAEDGGRAAVRRERRGEGQAMRDH